MAANRHHHSDGSFRNPWPRSGVPGGRAVLRMMREHFFEMRREVERHSPLERSRPVIIYPRAGREDLLATWIGHSTVLLQVGAMNVLTDPVFSRRASPVQWMGPQRTSDPGIALSALPPIDVVLISHNHYDHLDRGAVRHLVMANPDTAWVVPLGVGALLRRWGAQRVVELDWWESTEVGGMVISATPARHFSGRWIHDRNRSLWCGYAVSVEGHRVLFVGDTAYHDSFADIGARYGPFDFVMVPIGAYEPRWFMSAVHVDPEEAVQIYMDLVSAHPEAPPPLMLAIHWGTFRLTHEPVHEPPTLAIAHWEKVGLEAERLWIAQIGETRRVTDMSDTAEPGGKSESGATETG